MDIAALEIVLRQFYAAHHAVGAMATFALGPWLNQEGTHFLTGRWLFHDKPIPARPERVYGPLILCEQWFPGDEAVGALLRLLRGEPVLRNRPLRTRGENFYLLTNSRCENCYSGWPDLFDPGLHRWPGRTRRP
jgi:hypothetical protein